jgi:hypothetical protein
LSLKENKKIQKSKWEKTIAQTGRRAKRKCLLALWMFTEDKWPQIVCRFCRPLYAQAAVNIKSHAALQGVVMVTVVPSTRPYR